MDDKNLCRNNNYDLLRILATLGVIFIHANFNYFENKYMYPQMTANYCIECFINIATRYSVPCFIMMSGAFSLRNQRNSDPRYFYKKVLCKTILPAFLAETVFCLHDCCVAIIAKTSVLAPLKGLVYGSYAMWYLYMLCMIYLLTPLLFVIKNSLDSKSYGLFSLFLLVWGVISQAVSSYKLPYTMGTVGAFLGYYILGDYLLNYFKCKVPITCLSCVSILMYLVMFVFRYNGFEYYTYVTYRTFFSPAVCVASVCVFLLFKELHIRTRLDSIAKLTFGVYVFHSIILKYVHLYVVNSFLGISELYCICIEVLITALISLSVAFLYDKLCKRLWPVYHI